MIADIGNIIIARINTLPFLDKYVGVVRPITKTDMDKDNRPVKKTFPVSCQTDSDQCDGGRYIDLVPDTKKKSVLYLEDNGIRFIKQEGNMLHWKASLGLFCWINMPALGFSDCSYSSLAITGLISLLPDTFINVGNYQRIAINVVGQQSKAINPVAKYSYDESVSQFLMYPFDHFYLFLEVDFCINKRCLEVTAIGDPAACFTPTPRRYALVKDLEGNTLAQLMPGQVYTVEELIRIIDTVDGNTVTIIDPLT